MEDNNSPATNHPLWQNIFRDKNDHVTAVCQLWAETPLFKNVSGKHIRQLVKNMHPRLYKTDETIFKTGDIGAGAVLIKSGEVTIKAGNQVLAHLNQGDFFGEVALVVDEARTADAIASCDCELIFFLKPDLEEWLHNSPKPGAKLMMNISQILAGRLRHANDMLAKATNL